MDEEKQKVWVNGLRGGNSQVFEDVFLFYRPRIFSFLARLCRRRDTAEDLVQEVFMRLACNAPYLRPETHLAAWLFTVARNLLISKWRHSQYFSIQEVTDFSDISKADWVSPFDLIMVSETEQLIERALAYLPPILREALLLVTVEKLEQVDVAQMLGITHDALRQRLSRARSLLRELFNNLQQGKEIKR